jgi:hypothetical protein
VSILSPGILSGHEIDAVEPTRRPIIVIQHKGGSFFIGHELRHDDVAPTPRAPA